MTLTQVLYALRARWLVAALMLAVVLGATAAVSLSWPKRYAASASVVVDGKPDPVSMMISPNLGTPQFMATQVDILNSDRVAQRAVRNLKLADNPQVRAQWQQATGGAGSIEAWLGANFRRSMEARPSRESNVVTVTYTAPEPRFAAALANAFVQAYIDTVLEMRVNPAREYSAFFDTRLKEAREALEQAQARLSAFQRSKGIVAGDERLDIETARLNELSSQLVALHAISAESRSRQTQASSAQADRLPEVLANPVVAGLKADLSRAEAQLQGLTSRLGDAHPQVQEARANLTELRGKLESETRRVTSGVGVSNLINRDREAQIRAQLDAQRAKVLQLKEVRDEGAVIQRDVENAQRAYDAVQARLTQSSLESQTKLANVYPLTEATPPLEPSSPRIGLNMLVASFVGALLAVAAALGLELGDRRVRDPADLAAAIGVPVIAIVPDARRRRLSARRRDALMHQRVTRSLAAPAGPPR